MVSEAGEDLDNQDWSNQHRRWHLLATVGNYWSGFAFAFFLRSRVLMMLPATNAGINGPIAATRATSA